MSGKTTPHVTVCICTMLRPELLRRLLERVAKLQTYNGAFTLSCVVVDNDANGSARSVIARARSEYVLEVVDAVEPERNFALVRNRAVSLARGEFIAFIDDDEVPDSEWIFKLLETQSSTGADGVLGPVRPYFDVPPPKWIIRGGLCDRPVHPTGIQMHWSQSRTGNVLIRSSVFAAGGLRFDTSYATGGEDVDFFKRAMAAGYRFVWCEEAPAYELVPPERCRKSYFLKRGMLQGRISLKYAVDKLTPAARLRIGLQSMAALLLYALIIPAMAMGGFHRVMKYLIKGSHHLGRGCAVLGIDLIRQRPS
jgi:succinoglycan biosynthesis protein ExoM